MKNRIVLFLLFLITIFSWSCNEASKKTKDTEKKINKTANVKKKNVEAELLERLKNTTPANADDLAAWIPKTLGGLSLERTKSLAFQKDQSQMTGFYKRAGNKIINLQITDAAGSGGEIVANKIYVFGTEPDSNAGSIQSRSVNVNGRMARQDQNIEEKMINILFFHNKRFMIKISAFDYTVEQTWALVDELDFMALDALIE